MNWGPTMRPELASMLVLGLAAGPAMGDSQFLDRVESPVRSVDGASVRQLTEKARTCISQMVTYDAVVLRDSSRVSPMSAIPGDTSGDTTAVAGGDVLRTVDLDAGIIVAQSRIPWTRMMMNYVLESTITFEAKEGRFRITQTGIKQAMLSTGYMANTGFIPVRVQPGSPSAKIEAALQDHAAKIGDCVASADNSNW